MEQDKKLYMYVYRSLLNDIFNHVYTYDTKLPTLPKLCETYDVGRNTVRSALLKLQEDGYIEMKRGTQATITFDHDDEKLQQKYIQTLTDLRDVVNDVFVTMEYIFPYIGSMTLKNSTPEQLKILINKIDDFDIDNIHNEAQLIRELFEIYEVGFSLLNNPILDDLVTTLLYSIYLPVRPANYRKNIQKPVKNIQSTLKMIVKSKNSFIAKNLIAGLCHTYGKLINNYLDSVCGDTKRKENKQFVWSIHHNEDYLYMKVVFEIVSDINNHVYKKGDLLPSISQLSEQYNVSERTTRRTLEALRQYKIIKTINGVGSKVTIDIFKNNTKLLKNTEIKNNIQSYYYASSLLYMINDVVIPKVLKSVSDKEIQNLVDELEKSEYFSLTSFYDFIYRNTNSCLYTVYKELERYKIWGYFVNMLSDNSRSDILLAKESILVGIKNRNISLVKQKVQEVTEKSMELPLPK